MLPRLGKRAAERLLVTAGGPKFGRWWHRHRAVILAYHNIVPDGAGACGDRSLHLPRARFAEQLDRLSATHDVVTLEDLFQPHRQPERPRAVITFDDAYRGSLEYGLVELSRRGMPATVFVAPGLLGDRAFWWDLLASPRSGEVPAELRDRALTSAHGLQDQVLESLIPEASGVERVPPHSRSATEAELHAAVRRYDISIGSHTWSHANLTALDEQAVSQELRRSHGWLAERFASVVPWLAYPYGIFSEAVERQARESCEGALSLAGRIVPASVGPEDRHRVPRINIPAGMSLDGFELRISGVVRP